MLTAQGKALRLSRYDEPAADHTFGHDGIGDCPSVAAGVAACCSPTCIRSARSRLNRSRSISSRRRIFLKAGHPRKGRDREDARTGCDADAATGFHRARQARGRGRRLAVQQPPPPPAAEAGGVGRTAPGAAASRADRRRADAAAPAYKPPEPDLTRQIQRHARPAAADGTERRRQRADKGKDNFDAPATKSADIASSVVAAFRRHLRTCSKLPAALEGLRRRQGQAARVHGPGRQARGGAAADRGQRFRQGPALDASAISALQACQPYAMLPADRYGEWKVLDLSFTAQDFAGS